MSDLDTFVKSFCCYYKMIKILECEQNFLIYLLDYIAYAKMAYGAHLGFS